MTPILLTWNLPAKKAAKARMLAMRSGVRVAAVETWQYLQPLGSFTGDCGSMESLYDGAGFSEEMLLFAHFPETLLSRFLQSWKATGLPPVALKAVLTDTNRDWNSSCMSSLLRSATASAAVSAPRATTRRKKPTARKDFVEIVKICT